MGSPPDKTPIGRWPGRAVGRDNSRGIALVSVLWILALLAIIAGSFTSNARTNAKLAYNLVENAKARALADAGVNRAILALLQTPGGLDPGLLNLQTLGSDPAAAAQQRIEEALQEELGAGAEGLFEQRWRRDGTIYRFPFGEGEVLASIQDEGGKIDLNTASDALLNGLFVSVGVEAEEAGALVDSIADFRDADDFKRLNGAEADDYDAAGLDYGPRNSPFEAVEELHQVIGMTRELYDKVSPALTVDSGQPGIDPNTAPKEALLALPGVNTDDVEAMLAARANDPISALGTLQGIAAVNSFLSRGRGRAYTLRAEAHTEGGGVYVQEALIRLGGAAGRLFQFHAWRQGRLMAAVDGGES